MKIVLTQDVPKLGEMGTIQDVKPGFARNYLIPQGMALLATPGMVKQVEQRQAAERRRIAQLEEEKRELAERIEGTRIELHARVGEQGRLYGSITSGDIAEALSAEIGAEEPIDRRAIELEAPIREVGEFTVPVRLIGKLIPSITAVVFDPTAPLTAADLAEEGEEEAEEAAAEAQLEVTDAEAEAINAEAGEDEAIQSLEEEVTPEESAGDEEPTSDDE